MLFGHQNDAAGGNGPQAYQNNPLAVDPETGASLPVAPSDPTVSTTPADTQSDTYLTDAATAPQPHDDAQAAPVQDGIGQGSVPLSVDDQTLLDLKQQALEQLSPLVSHLEQSPEEKFRTTMMMIQSSDNQALIKDAYEAAQAIPDDKARAQALLDIVNEINYFTQSHDS